jgi:NO-binding membrane sensor protein with MHYT domain
VAEVHHFTYGVFNPIAAYLLAFLGSFLGLLSTGRARTVHTRGRRNRWLIIAAFSIGGGALWLMHFAAMLGFDVPDSPVRYDPMMTMLSLAVAVAAVGIGLLVVGHGRRGPVKIGVAGVITGLGVLGMQYIGIEGMHVAGQIHYRPTLVIASAVVAVVAATVVLWCAVSIGGWGRIAGAAAVVAVAVCGMHYLAMAAIQVRLSPVVPEAVSGLRPLVMIVPITLVTAAIIIGVALCALQAMTEEEFSDSAGGPKRGMHAQAEHSWSLKQASLAAMRRNSTPRPSPRPVPPRPMPPRPVDTTLQPAQTS